MQRSFKGAAVGSSFSDFRDARFNQDSSCLAVSCATGFRIYNCNPFALAKNRDLSGHARGTLRTVEMMYRCNIIAIIGDSALPSDVSSKRSAHKGPLWQGNVLILWDDKAGCEVAQLVFNKEILNVKLSRNLLVVAVEDKLYVYQLQTVKLLDTFSTWYNPQGLCALSENEAINVLAFPGSHRGTLCVRLYHTDSGIDTFSADDSVLIEAHESDICAVGLSIDGLLVVTASSCGTFVRLWSALSGIKLQEFRKSAGGGVLRICHLSQDTHFLCTVSDSDVVCVYRVRLRAKAKRRVTPGGTGCISDAISSPSSSRICLPLKILRHTRLYLEAPSPYSRFRSPASVMAATFLPNTNNLLLVLANGRVHRLSIASHFKLLGNHAL
ncbi:Autophagy-related protein 18d [Babesia sp. Xinjiang]|uniref:Autophagy-related protein 18d n=1 Tax=Babesia sp. Xinjiang TaxID=462227 RepID=UPI000A235198|nr:Autophagy-related protein 18d [Babesia sp. Xinjiang]ORM39653.1 Autophagy-related protein 18d [Babesia sp. Xinjiang]